VQQAEHVPFAFQWVPANVGAGKGQTPEQVKWEHREKDDPSQGPRDQTPT